MRPWREDAVAQRDALHLSTLESKGHAALIGLSHEIVRKSDSALFEGFTLWKGRHGLDLR